MTIAASVYLITKNCEATLAGTLASVADFAEIVLVDSGSSDNTLAIARQFNCRIYHQDWLGFAKQKQLALSYCQYDWVLNLDGDEELSSELKHEIEHCIHLNQIDGLDTPIDDYFLNCPPSRAGKFNSKIRFFRKSAGGYDLEKQVHESITVQGTVLKARGKIRHYGENTIYIKVQKTNDYSQLRAQEKAQRGKRVNLLKLIMIMPLEFIKSYILRRAFLNGTRGFINSMVNAFYAFLKEAKLYEYQLKQKQSK